MKEEVVRTRKKARQRPPRAVDACRHRAPLLTRTSRNQPRPRHATKAQRIGERPPEVLDRRLGGERRASIGPSDHPLLVRGAATSIYRSTFCLQEGAAKSSPWRPFPPGHAPGLEDAQPVPRLRCSTHDTPAVANGPGIGACMPGTMLGIFTAYSLNHSPSARPRGAARLPRALLIWCGSLSAILSSFMCPGLFLPIVVLSLFVSRLITLPPG